MKKILLLLFIAFLAINFTYSQTTYSWRNDQGSAATGQWNVSNNWWNGSGAALPGGAEILFLDGSVGQWMTNDLPSTNRFRIFLGSGGAARSITGSTENTFYDYGGANPKIENNSSDAIGLSIDFPIKVGHTTMEINPADGPIAISKAINNDGNDIAVWGDNGKVLGIGLGLSGSGGLSINQNSTVSFFNTAVTYSGTTTLNAGILDLQVSAANTDITVKSGAMLSINGTYITVKSITVEAGGSVQINSGKSLTVTGNFANSGTVTIKSDDAGTGSLIVNGTVTGTIAVERYIPGYSKGTGWHYLSSPVSTQAISSFHTPGGNDDFYSWDEASYTWINRTADGGGLNGSFETNFLVGTGYLAANSATSTKTFSGTLNNTDVVFGGLTHQGAVDDGWHLMGNPFSSGVQWNKTGGSWSLSNIVTTAKGYDESSGNFTDIAQDAYIAAMQGFFVQVTSGFTGDLTIPTAAKGHGGSWAKEEIQSLKLLISGGSNTYSDIIRVNTNDMATNEFDYEFDSHKMFGDATAPQLFTKMGEENYSTNSFNYERSGKSIDLAFRAGTDGEHTIEVVLNTLENADGVYLEDLVENIIIDLNKSSTYAFSATIGDNENRFQLHFGATGINELVANSLQAYMIGQSLIIVGEEGPAELSIFDIQGKQLLNENVELSNDYKKSLYLPSGVYVVRVQTSEFVKTNKVIIK